MGGPNLSMEGALFKVVPGPLTNVIKHKILGDWAYPWALQNRWTDRDCSLGGEHVWAQYSGHIDATWQIWWLDFCMAAAMRDVTTNSV